MVHPPEAPRPATARAYGTIVVVGGGCYGAYYVRQLGRARAAGALAWRRVFVVDRDPACRVARERPPDDLMPGLEIIVSDWTAYFARWLAEAAASPAAAADDAIVPSPLMPHVMFDWLAARARQRWPEREIGLAPLDAPPAVPWQRAGADGTHYVSFAEWQCPINCIEPARCPVTRGVRDWSMPPAMDAYVRAERARGHDVAGPAIFHCTHRAYGVGMFDVAEVLAGDAIVRDAAAHCGARVLIGTVSHCHGALGLLRVGAPSPPMAHALDYSRSEAARAAPRDQETDEA